MMWVTTQPVGGGEVNQYGGNRGEFMTGPAGGLQRRPHWYRSFPDSVHTPVADCGNPCKFEVRCFGACEFSESIKGASRHDYSNVDCVPPGRSAQDSVGLPFCPVSAV
jgi:hypothetical protein